MNFEQNNIGKINTYEEKINKSLEKEKKEKEAYESNLLIFVKECIDDPSVNKNHLMRGLCGIESEAADELRLKLIEGGGIGGESVSIGLIGSDSPESWGIRNQLIDSDNEGILTKNVVRSIYSLNSSQALEVRKKCIDEYSSWKVFDHEALHEMLLGLRGLDDKESWEFRNFGLTTDMFRTVLCHTLNGLDSDEAWELRKKFSLADSDDLFYLSKQIYGLDSDEAWSMREKMGDEYCLQSLQGVDNEKSNLKRNSLLESNPKDVAISLCECNSPESFEIRKKIFDNIINSEKEKFDNNAFDERDKKGLIMWHLLRSLKGLDSNEAWELRNNAFENRHICDGQFISWGFRDSVCGVDSKESWDFIEKIKQEYGNLFINMMNYNSQRAWEERRKILQSGDLINFCFQDSILLRNSQIKK